MPVFLCFAPFVVRIVLGYVVADQGDAAATVHAMDHPYAACLFWVWAVTTNAYSQRLASSGGERAGNQEDRRAEFLEIVIQGTVAFVLVLLVCVKGVRAIGWMPLGVGFLLFVACVEFMIRERK